MTQQKYAEVQKKFRLPNGFLIIVLKTTEDPISSRYFFVKQVTSLSA
jgi:hypothetical protein